MKNEIKKTKVKTSPLLQNDKNASSVNITYFGSGESVRPEHKTSLIWFSGSNQLSIGNI